MRCDAARAGAQHMDAGPRSASLGALGSRSAAGFMGTHKPDNFSLAEVLAKGAHHKLLGAIL